MHDCIDRIILIVFFFRSLLFNVRCELNTDALDLVKLLASDHPKPVERHMIIELRQMQRKLQLDEREMRKLVVPLLSVKDSLSYFSDCPIVVQHIPGKTNPADCLTKPVDLKLLVAQFMIST